MENEMADLAAKTTVDISADVDTIIPKCDKKSSIKQLLHTKMGKSRVPTRKL